MAVDLDEIRKMLKKREEEKKNNGGGGGRDFNWVEMPEDGEIKIRFLPPVGNAPLPGIVVRKHYDLPEKGSLNCLAQYDMRCPICEVLEKFADKINIDTWSPGSASYFNVNVVDHPKHKNGEVYLLRSSEFTYYWLLEQIVNPDVGDITDPRTGSNVTFKRKSHKGSFERTIGRLSVGIAPTEEGIKAILDSAYNLQEIWRTPDTAYVNTVITCAEALNAELTRRIQMLENSEFGNGGNSTPPSQTSTPPSTPSQPTPPVEDKKPVDPPSQTSTPPPQSAPPPTPSVETKATDVPAGAPECYGKEFDENARKCMLCSHEFSCSKTRQ